MLPPEFDVRGTRPTAQPTYAELAARARDAFARGVQEQPDEWVLHLYLGKACAAADVLVTTATALKAHLTRGEQQPLLSSVLPYRRPTLARPPGAGMRSGHSVAPQQQTVYRLRLLDLLFPARWRRIATLRSALNLSLIRPLSRKTVW